MWSPSNKEKKEWRLIKDVFPLDDYIIRVQFYDGSIKEYDLKPLFNNLPYWEGKPIFNDLKDNKKLYYSAHTDKYGFAVKWNDIIDLDCEEIYDEGKDVVTPFAGLLSFSDACFLWNLNESTLRKAVQYKKLKPGIDCCKYGNQWIISVEAMKREYGEAAELIKI